MADNNNPIYYKDLVRPDNSITELIRQLDELSDAYMNTLKNIKSEAIHVKTALSGVSGATESGRKSIKGAVNDTDRLTRAARDLAFAESDNAKRLADLKQAQKEANDINKLVIKINQSAEGSYNRLSAQYSLNKIYLNNMSIEEREATEEGRQLVAETKAIYKEMSRLQAATGKMTLNVGNYSDAACGLTTQIENQTKELALLRLQGKQGSEEYNRLAKQTAMLRDAVKDATTEITNMASDTSSLDSVLSLASGAAGGFAAYTGAMELFGAKSEDVEEAQRKLQAVIALTTGVQQIATAVQKQSALMVGISRIQTAALSKAKIFDRLVTMQGTKATVGATVAQKAFNLVAAANPYVLLAIALITVVGALVLYAASANKSAKEQQKLNEAQRAWLDFLEREEEDIKRTSSLRINKLENELKVAKARNASISETRKIEDEIAKERLRAHKEVTAQYKEEIKNVELNQRNLKKLSAALEAVEKAKAKGDKKVLIDVDFDGDVEKTDIEEAIKSIQGKFDEVNRKIEVGIRLRTETADIEAERKAMLNERLRENRELMRNETDILRKAEDTRLALTYETYTKQRAQAKAETNRAIEDIQYQLKTEANLSTKSREALNNQIVDLRKQLEDRLIDIDNEQRAAELAIVRTTEDMRISLMDESAEKQRKLLQTEYDRQIEDITIRLSTERTLSEKEVTLLLNQQLALRQKYAKEIQKLDEQIAIDQLQAETNRLQLRLDSLVGESDEELTLRIAMLQKQRQIELAQNRQLAVELRQDEKDINAKYDAEILRQTTEFQRNRMLLLFDHQQAYEKSEFDLLRNSEAAKTRFRLQQEKKRWEQILKYNEIAGIKLSDVEAETIRNIIAKIDQEIANNKSDERGKDIYGLFGLNLEDREKEGISTSVAFAVEQLNVFLDAKLKAAEAAVEASNKEVESAQKALDAELQARANGYASNVIMAQKELDLAKRNQEKALKEQQKMQKAQQAIQALEQVGNLVTASALIWSQLGFPLAIPAIAVMWASFAAAKVKAAQLTKSQSATETYGEGTVELLQGGSHKSGNDIDLGTKPDGTRRRAEGGEFFAVINKRNSRRYRKVIPDVIKSLNDGSFATRYINAYTEGNNLALNITNNNLDIRELSEDVRQIKEQNKRKIIITPNGVIEQYKNLTRKYKNN